MLERQDARLSSCNAVFLTKPSISISLCRDQDAPITKGCEVPADHTGLKTRFVTTQHSLAVFSAINYQPFSPPDSFNLVNKPDQTKATCHNNHCPTTFRRLGRNTVWVGLRLIFTANTCK